MSSSPDHQINDGIRANKYGIIQNVVGLVIVIFLIIFCLFVSDRPSCNFLGTISNSCSTTNECFSNYLSHDGNTCSSFPKKNGSDCDPDELCFNHSACQPTCQNCVYAKCQEPQCTGPRECCNGLCSSDDDCAAKIQFNVQSFNYTCLIDTCFYTIYNTQTSYAPQCLELVVGPVKNCLHATTTDYIGFSGYCSFHYKCAPPLTGVPPGG
jgi:hypothetical protein